MRRPTDYAKSQFNALVGRSVRDARHAADMSIAKLSDAVGVSTSMLANIESGATPLPLWTARNIADVVDCTIDDLAPVTIDEPAED